MADTIESSHDSLTRPLIEPASAESSTNVKPSRQLRATGDTDARETKKFPIFCILLTVMLERLAYYSLLGNLVIYVNSALEWSPSTTVILVLTFTGLTWISCFIGGLLGDVYFGRFNTILFGLAAYFVGFLCLPFITYVTKISGDSDKIAYGRQPYVVVWFCFALLLVSLGEGCFKANMSPFGADQLSKRNDTQMQRFFSYFYWTINIGSFLGFGPMIYLQNWKSFTVGYGVSAGCLLLAGIVFVCPTRKAYFVASKTHNVISTTVHIFKEAWKNRKKSPNQRYTLNRRTIASEYDGSGCFEDFVPIKHWLDRAMTKYGGSHLDTEVEEVKALLSIVPVFSFLIVYCILYFQTLGTFILQGMHMDVNYGSWHMPAAWLALTNNITVLIFVPIFDRLLYPCLAKYNIKIPYVVRMMIGMLLASCAMLSAGLVEVKRLSVNATTINHINDKYVIATDMSIFYQIPQFVLIGVSEIFVLMTGLEFAYCKAPRKMQAIVTGLFFIANGIGSMLGSLIVEIGTLAKKFVSTQVEQGKVIQNIDANLDYLFFGLALLNLINLIFFAYFCWRRRKKEQKKKPQETSDQYIRSTGGVKKAKNTRALRSDDNLI
eukprot:gene13920-15372_t